jgi:hypothetical protein
VRAVIALAAGTMAAGFADWRAGVLVAALTALTYVLLATVTPRLPARDPATERSLRALERHGYRVLRAGAARRLVVGPAGAYLVEAPARPPAITGTPGGWRIGGAPADRVAGRLAAAAARLEEALAPGGGGPAVVPVVVVAGRLPAPVMRSGPAVIARPRAAARYILGRPMAFDAADTAAVVAAARPHLG